MAENTTQQQRLSRAEIIKRNAENKKNVIDNNVNAAVFVSETKASNQIFSSVRMFDALDSAIRRLWGVSIDMDEVAKWFAGVKELQAKFAELQVLGTNLLVKANSPRDISNRVLRNIVANEINARAKAEKAAKTEKAETQTAQTQTAQTQTAQTETASANEPAKKVTTKKKAS